MGEGLIVLRYFVSTSSEAKLGLGHWQLSEMN